MLFYTSAGEGKRLAQIWISSWGKGGEQPALTSQPVPLVETTPIAEESDGDIAQLLDAVIQTALSDPDPSLRLKAIELLGAHAGEDSRTKAILSQVAHDGSPQVQEAVAAMLKDME
ncbi:MAG: HEAT repeat domain-containing protein [Deltaproteobacteria bacterium]|nr:HEAT repeat domain-containing protein [Deltaproteobacteria bacterium]